MFKRFFPSILLTTIVCLLYASCDSTPTLNNYDSTLSYVQNLSVTPDQIQFSPILDGQKDTTITLEISVDGFSFDEGSVPYYYIFYSGDETPSLQGTLNIVTGTSTFHASVAIPTNTIEFNSYTILVTPSLNGENKNYAQAVVKQTGVPINAPEILEVNNPSNVQIPASGATIAVFEAKVTDIDGQDNIDKVFLNFRNPDGSLLQENPFQMLDDGSSESGDVAANDSVFTKTFSINSSNTANNRTALYWAIDKSGLNSDTLETSFNIVDNE